MQATKKNKETSVGIVLEAFPNTIFKIRLENDKGEILAYLAGKMRMNRIKILVGDRVEVLLDEYGGKGRIIRRL